MKWYKDCGYLTFNNRLYLYDYDGLTAEINKALKYKLMGFFFQLRSHFMLKVQKMTVFE